MWSYFWILTLCAAITVSLTATTHAPKCDDVDTSACQLLQVQRPDLCKDDTLARSICARFCKLCPIECYHCDATYTDYHMCNRTVLCQSGEVCMKKELISFEDGHHEYELTCQDRRICDGGSDLTIPFGKRHVNSRDISVKCCVDDLCNYPEVTTTTATTTTTTTTKKQGCPKDIIFLVDATLGGWGFHFDLQATKDLITSIVQRLDIGTRDNLVALYTIEKDLETEFELQRYTDKTSLLSHINSFNKTAGRFHAINTSHAIHTLVSHASHGHFGDRRTYPDVVVIIGNMRTTNNLHLSSSDKQHLQQISHDVIVLDVGGTLGIFHNYFHPRDDLLATDDNHIIQTTDLNTKSLTDKLYQLIIEC